jgi:hypothetical protein
MTKFGMVDGDEPTVCFSVINKGVQFDNEIIAQLVDDKLILDDGYCPNRKDPSVLDLMYTLFNNDSVLQRIDNDMVSFGSYYDHLQALKELCVNHVFDDTLYGQELKMLMALTADVDTWDELNMKPFNGKAMLEKLSGDQLGHYAELRHDNVLYLDENCGMRCLCQHPDLMVEPVVTCWKEMLKLVGMFKALACTDIDKKIINSFETVIGKLLKFLKLQMSGEIDEKLMEELMCICKQESRGSGSSEYNGWYFSLFHDKEDALKVKPEVSTFYTSVDDVRGPGNISTLGTGSCKMVYYHVVDEKRGIDKIMLGPTYGVYSFVTGYNDRLNDDDFAKRIGEFSQFEL